LKGIQMFPSSDLWSRETSL